MEQLTNAQFADCEREFKQLGENALYLNHYQLAAETNIKDPIRWKKFLTDPRIADYISSEMNLIRTASINKITHEAPNSKSVGQAQLINALVKIDEAATDKSGPVFIYSYVPLNDEQAFAPNVLMPQQSEEIIEEVIEEEEITLEDLEISTDIPRE